MPHAPCPHAPMPPCPMQHAPMPVLWGGTWVVLGGGGLVPLAHSLLHPPPHPLVPACCTGTSSANAGEDSLAEQRAAEQRASDEAHTVGWGGSEPCGWVGGWQRGAGAVDWQHASSSIGEVAVLPSLGPCELGCAVRPACADLCHLFPSTPPYPPPPVCPSPTPPTPFPPSPVDPGGHHTRVCCPQAARGGGCQER
jgi:hypothetical protein